VNKILCYVLVLCTYTFVAHAALEEPRPSSKEDFVEIMRFIHFELRTKRDLLQKELDIRQVPHSILPSWATLVDLSSIDTTAIEPTVAEGYMVTNTLIRAPFTIYGQTTEGVPIMYVLGTVSIDPRDPTRAATSTVRFDLYADITLNARDTHTTRVRLNLLNQTVPIFALKGGTWKPITRTHVRTTLLERLGVVATVPKGVPPSSDAPTTPAPDYGI
jgi:hypothetical protein